MKKLDIIRLHNCGIAYMTAQQLDTAHAYKTFKLKREVEKLYSDIEDEHKAILRDCGITEEMERQVQKISAKANTGEPLSGEEKDVLTGYQDKHSKAVSIIEVANQAEVTLEVKSIPYAEWRKLQTENKEKKVGEAQVDILGGVAEIILEEVFWRAPEENEEPTK